MSGKYDADNETLLIKYDAELVVTIVLGGRKGSGSAVSSKQKETLQHLPEVLQNFVDFLKEEDTAIVSAVPQCNSTH